MHSSHWNIWIDTGGTFTDCLARDPSGLLHRAKVLSTGAMRGRIVDSLRGSRLKIDVNWEDRKANAHSLSGSRQVVNGKKR